MSLQDCPPRKAGPAEGTVFRCCKSDPPSARDMQTAEESERHFDADPCKRKALSVFTRRRDAFHQIRLFPGWRRGFIASADLTPPHGRILATPGAQPSHTSWWPSQGLAAGDRAALFRTESEVLK